MTPSSKSSTDPATELSDLSVRLEIKGQHIPSFKNAKRIVGDKLVTRQDIKDRKKSIEESFVWQLLSDTRIASLATQMGLSRQSLIASLVPADDCWTVIPEIEIKCELVEPGQEGCEVIIKKIG